MDLAMSFGDDQDEGGTEGEYDSFTLEFDEGTPELLVLRRTLLQCSNLTETKATLTQVPLIDNVVLVPLA